MFASAREARAFGLWLTDHFEEIRTAAESTTRSGKLQDIEQYSASRILFTRFNYTTGDAAGQNLTGKATQEACRWITANYDDIEHYFLESNFATDKKSSQVNMLRTRGKRVVAEATIPNELFERIMRANTDLIERVKFCGSGRRTVTTTRWSRPSTTATLTVSSRGQRSFQPALVVSYSSTRACISTLRSSVGSSRS